MIIEISKLIHAPKSKVFAWCTDYQEIDTQYSGGRLKKRRILERTPGTVLIEQSGVALQPYTAKIRVSLHPPNGWDADEKTESWDSRNEYRLTEVPEGTRLDIRFTITIRGIAGLFSPLLKPLIHRNLESEWDGYVRGIEKEDST